jgi:hypothetical protein
MTDQHDANAGDNSARTVRQLLGGRYGANGPEAEVYVVLREVLPGYFRHDPGSLWMFAGEYKGTGVVDEMLDRLDKSGGRIYRTGDIVAELTPLRIQGCGIG